MTLYNYKIIYTTSYIEIYKYERAIYKNPKIENKSKIEIDEKQEDINIQEKETRKLKRLAQYRKSVKAELVRIIDNNYDNKTSFITLTTKQNITNREEFTQMFHKFITRCNYNFLKTKKRKLKYIAVLEKQERGAFHAHMIIFDIGYLPHDKLSEVWGNGFVWINKLNGIDSVANVGRYVAKYMEKGIGQEILENKHKKSYFSSRNLNKPRVQKLYFSNDAFRELIDNSEIQYESEYSTKYFLDNKFINNKVKYTKIKKG